MSSVEHRTQRTESREGSVERKASKDRDEKLRYARERQNEERQRKIEELKAQAEAAQRYREQKEEERRRRIEEIRVRDTEKRQQVEERKKAILEAEKERREYILRKNQERESRIETKRRERNSIGFAFGSSTPRLLEPADFGMVSPSTFLGQRRSTSISNVANTSLSRRSSERELTESGTKKRATSASGTERHDEDNADTSPIMFRSVYRRKTDLMPTIPSPRDGHYGSRNSLSTPPSRTPGRAYSMNRLDQLAQPIRRNGEHIRAILERERRTRDLEMLDETVSLSGGINGQRTGSAGSTNRSNSTSGTMSRSMTHLAGNRGKYSLGGGISTNFRPLGNSSRDSCKSLSQLNNYWANIPKTSSQTPRSNLGLQTAATKKYLQSSIASNAYATKRGQQHFLRNTTNPSRFDPNSLLLMNSSSLLVNAGSRSGNATPGGHLNLSRPGSAMSTSTIMSNSGNVTKRATPAQRKPRPASIAGTGVSLEEINKLKKDQKPPAKTSGLSAQTTPKRSPNLMSTSLIVTSSSRLSSAEKKTPSKRDIIPTKALSASKALSKTVSSERINKVIKDTKPKEISGSMAKSMVATSNSGGYLNQEEIENVKTSVTTELPAREQHTEDTNSVNSVNKDAVDENQKIVVSTVSSSDEVNEENKTIDKGSDNNDTELEYVISKEPRNGSKENSVVRETTPPSLMPNTTEAIDMTASMIAKKITTEEEAKAALAERRRLAREEAERLAELERKRIEAERQAELKRQEEEAERQRKFEEEAMRLAEEQRRTEEERLRKAIEEAKQREEEERLKREEEERQRLEREEAEKKAREEAEKQRIEVAERLKREEKEREERRKRVEAIMSRTRKAGSATASNTSSPVASNSIPTPAKTENNETTNTTTQHLQNQGDTAVSSSESGSLTPSGASDAAATVPTPTIPVQSPAANTTATTVNESQNSQAMYEQSVVDKENSLINSFSSMIIDENAKNTHQIEVSNGKLLGNFTNSDSILQNATTAVANGNGHIQNVNNKNDINLLQDAVTPASNQLIDLSIESQDINNSLNYNNNNSLLTTTLVTADSHDNKDISLL